MSLPIHILDILMYYSGGYRSLYKKTRRDNAVSDNTLHVTLSRIKEIGLVSNCEGMWSITLRGRAYLAKTQKKETLPAHTVKQLTPKQNSMIIIFDIPETQKRKRELLRVELSNLGFAMLQKSVWFGPAPIPKEFIRSLDHTKLLRYVKFFKATEADIV